MANVRLAHDLSGHGLISEGFRDCLRMSLHEGLGIAHDRKAARGDSVLQAVAMSVLGSTLVSKISGVENYVRIFIVVLWVFVFPVPEHLQLWPGGDSPLNLRYTHFSPHFAPNSPHPVICTGCSLREPFSEAA